jgi:hypothetical protein
MQVKKRGARLSTDPVRRGLYTLDRRETCFTLAYEKSIFGKR